MTAKRMEGIPVGGTRHKLIDALPLKIPFTMQFFPIYSCNFKCRYCAQSIPMDKRPQITSKIKMELEDFKKVVDSIQNMTKQVQEKIKLIHFAGLGEPLLHPDIAKMVKYTKDKNIADAVDIITNGSLLTPNLIDKLVDAKIDKIRISLQGLDSEKYKEICGVTIDFDKFMKNLEYLYKHRNGTKVYIKILDATISEKREKFINMFGGLADEIAVESLAPVVSEIDYKNEFSKENFSQTMLNLDVREANICPLMFYTVDVYPDGNVMPCGSYDPPEPIGNIFNESFTEIWNGGKIKQFRKNFLLGKKTATCKKCTLYRYCMFPEDYLDDDIEKLKEIYCN